VSNTYFWPRISGGTGFGIDCVLAAAPENYFSFTRRRGGYRQWFSRGRLIDPALSSVLKALHA
jgi:hypothetical protein